MDTKPTEEPEKADIIVGIPSYNEADAISYVTRQVALGLKNFYPQYSCLIINVDNNSPDNTKEAFLSTPTEDIPKRYISTPPGVKGKGNNFYNLFKAVKELKPKAVVVVDADLKSITPDWIKSLAEPILRGADLVTPLYSRHKYDGTITNNIVYPITVGLLGKNIRQPIGGDFSFSSRLAGHWLEQEWSETIRHFGIDIFMTTHALLGGFKVCSATLGAKIHKVKDPGESLGPMFKQVIGTLFSVINDNKHAIPNNGIEQPIIFGNTELQEPQAMCINTDNLRRNYNNGMSNKKHILKQYLSETTYADLNNVSLEINNISADLWARTLYDLLVAYPRAENKEELLEAMQPLYFGRVYSFAKETSGMGHEEAEAEVQRQAKIFHEMKEYALKHLVGTPITQVAK